MRKLIPVLVASFVAFLAIGSITTAHAAIGYRYLPEGVTRMQMIGMTDAALKRDRENHWQLGHSPLMPQRCEQEHDRDACATPYDYYVVYKEKDPNPILTDDVQSTLPFLQSLKDGPAPNDGEYLMSCLVPTNVPGKYKPRVECDHRSFNKGEMVSYDPVTNKIVLAWHCKNPVVGKWEVPALPPPVPCPILEVTTKHRGMLRYGALIQPGTNLDDSTHCLAAKFPGETAYHTWVDNCPDQRCDYDKYEGMTGRKIVAFGSQVSEGGVVYIRLPPNFAKAGDFSMVMLCLTEADGRQACAQGVKSNNYTLQHDEVPAGSPPIPTAYVTYTPEERGSRHPGVSWHWNVGVDCAFD